MNTFLLSFRELLEYILVPLLLGTGLWLTFRLQFVQFRRFWHGLLVVSGKYDDPEASGDVSHFQALTTALSATVGIGNIAGVAIAIHWGGPGAIFWMWVTAILGMATKFTEVSLAQKFKIVHPPAAGTTGQVSGGPMYYIESGLGPKWKPVAIFFAFALMSTALITGNAVQANTFADLGQTVLGIPVWITGLFSALAVGIVIVGGITRIGKVTSLLAPIMAALYIMGGLAVIVANADQVLPVFQLILTEAFQPSAGIAGTGTGVFLQTLIWGVRRGLFSNEAGQGSAPVAHAAAKTDEPVSEGGVALLEPFIDTILICSITALAILTTGVWKEQTPTIIALSSGDISYIEKEAIQWAPIRALPREIDVKGGKIEGTIQLAWHEVAVPVFYTNEEMTIPFDGRLLPEEDKAIDHQGKEYVELYGLAVETGAPLTMWAYKKVLGNWGVLIITLCVMLFGISTAIAWSYYGDRCAIYLFGPSATQPYRIIYVALHFTGAILSLNLIWNMGDVFMSLGTIPNVIALLFLSGMVRKMMRNYELRTTKNK